MQEVNKTNNQPDDFSNLIRQKLEDHRMPVESCCWDEIEFRMKSGKKRFVRWIGCSVAAIAAVIVLLFFIRQDNESSIYRVYTITVEKKKEKEETILNDREKKEAIRKGTFDNKLSDKKGYKKTKIQATDIIENREASYLVEIEDTIIQLADNGIIGLDKNGDKTTSDTIKKINKQKEFYTPEKILIAKTNNEDSKWLIAASISSGGGISMSNSDMVYSYLNSDTEVTSPPFFGNSDELRLDEFSDVDHSLPISFGINVRKDFNKYIGIETGLVYTYLSSRYKNQGKYKRMAQQELHYLGIPINLVVYLYNDPKWNFYFTTGVMGEKGIYSSYKQDIYLNNEKINTTKDNRSIRGMQWSLNVSIGISYNFRKDWSLYIEPGYSYYFDNNQPISIRTEKPNVFGIGAGLRYKF